MKNNYKIIKLRSGESLICGMGMVKDKTIVLERPMVFKTMPIPNNPLLFGAEALLLKDWLEFSNENTVEIPIDHIAALIKPDKMITQCYEIEKEKLDNPSFKQEMMEKMKEDMENKINSLPPIPEKLNINFNVPKDMIPEVLDALGIDIDMDMEEDDGILEEEIEGEVLPPEPKPKKKKKKTNNKNKKEDPNWGNNWSDWPADPHDYL
jgi:hypothetical protein